jgi:O-antigen/teichoic acid export membrane protein/glycosyltransferase involved in cell wall biosynthesis
MSLLKPFDAHGAFRPGLGDGEVRRLAIRGAGVTVLSGGFGLAIQIAATVVLARLLTPKDFGVVTMVTTFSLLLMNFGLNGFTEAILQADEINQFLVSNIFWINAGIGLALTACFAAAGTLMARFYHDPLVARVAIGISPTIFITSISVQHIALLKRAMHFSATSSNEVLSRAISMATSIALALKGWGYWALVAGAVMLPLSQTIGAWFLCPWLPSFPRRVKGTGSMTRFAMNVYGRFTINYFARNTDNVLVGWRFGPISLGFYKKAYDLFALSAGQLAAPITNVAVSALSRYNARSVQYRQHVLSALSVTAFAGMALSGEFALIGKDLIRVLLGPGWESAGRIFTFFAPGIGAMLIYYLHSWIHLSIGRADRWLRWGIVEVIATCGLFLIALPWGPVGIAVAWSASYWALIIPSLWYAGAPIQFPVSTMVAAIWKYVAASLLAGFATVGIGQMFPSLLSLPRSIQQAVAGIAAISVIFVVLYLGTVVMLYRGLAPVRQVARLFAEMISRPDTSTSPVAVSATFNAQLQPEIISKGSGQEPLVSILIPAFNAEEWIADTLRSAIEQTWRRREIIVVDDGSTDQTVAITRQFESDGVRVVQQANQGAAAARNKALSLCCGDYIQWLDADDLLAPDKIAAQMAVSSQIGSGKILLSSGFGKFRYQRRTAQFAPSSLWEDLSPAEWLRRKMGENLYMQTATWLISRELSRATGPWDTRMLSDDDGEYFCRALLNSNGTRFVPGAKVYYRAFGFNSLAHVGRSEKKRDALWLSMQLHIRYLLSLEDTPRTREACLTYLQRNLINFYPDRADIVKQAEQTARTLGGVLHPPELSWKYSWMQHVFGWDLTNRAQVFLPQIKCWIVKSGDKALFRLRNRFFPVEQ